VLCNEACGIGNVLFGSFDCNTKSLCICYICLCHYYGIESLHSDIRGHFVVKVVTEPCKMIGNKGKIVFGV